MMFKKYKTNYTADDLYFDIIEQNNVNKALFYLAKQKFNNFKECLKAVQYVENIQCLEKKYNKITNKNLILETTTSTMGI